MSCQGSCANVTLNLNYSPITVFLCDPYKVCEEKGFVEKCGFVTDSMTMCCCTTSTFCNVRPSIEPGFFNNTFTIAPPRKNISCYAGIELNPSSVDNLKKRDFILESGNLTTLFPEVVKPTNLYSGSYMDCSGECANLTLGDIGTLYLCDPIEVCSGLKMTNTCATIDPLVTGCCCSTSECNNKNGDPDQKSSTSFTLTTPLTSSVSKRLNFHIGYSFFVYLVFKFLTFL